jgi:hypothetical protein
MKRHYRRRSLTILNVLCRRHRRTGTRISSAVPAGEFRVSAPRCPFGGRGVCTKPWIAAFLRRKKMPGKNWTD